MSRRILKTALAHEKSQVVELPTSWRPLRFANQKGSPTIWYEADGDSLSPRAVYLIFTGEEVVPKSRYLGTDFFGLDGSFVVHCYIGGN